MTPFQCFLHPRRAAALIRREPFLPVELEDDSAPDWHERALMTLAKMLGYANDYYFPLIGAADNLRSQRQEIEELKHDLTKAVENHTAELAE
jgi:hypothetical protein